MLEGFQERFWKESISIYRGILARILRLFLPRTSEEVLSVILGRTPGGVFGSIPHGFLQSIPEMLKNLQNFGDVFGGI